MSATADAPLTAADGSALRARRTAALTRVAVGGCGAALIVARPSLLAEPALGVVAFAAIMLTSLVQLTAPELALLDLEESLSGICAILIVGLGDQRVNVLSILWLVALATGVLARGGRRHFYGPVIVLLAVLLPIFRSGEVSAEYAGLCAATLGLLLTSGRLMRELGQLLAAARLQAQSAETLLRAGDIAARLGERTGRETQARAAAAAQPQARERATAALERLIAGDGLSTVVQPIVDTTSGSVHAYEALSRFASPGIEGGPLHWLSLADELDRRAELERACLRSALGVFPLRPAGTSLSLNLSASVLLDPLTQRELHDAAHGEHGLRGLIVEITEETLVDGEMGLLSAFEPLRELGACLAVDDMGAGYSGLSQITSVRPRYLKLDRALVSGVDTDEQRAALLGALAGYSRQVGCLLVAEGVETEAELRTVRALGAPLVQGFVFGRPAAPWPRPRADALCRDGAAARPHHTRSRPRGRGRVGAAA